MKSTKKQIDNQTNSSSSDLLIADLARVTNLTSGYWKYNHTPTKEQYRKFYNDMEESFK